MPDNPVYNLTQGSTDESPWTVVARVLKQMQDREALLVARVEALETARASAPPAPVRTTRVAEVIRDPETHQIVRLNIHDTQEPA